MSVVTNEDKINELLERGVEKVYPSKEELKKKLLSGEKITLYGGFDPSAPSLHIGNAILINKLSQFQELGHEVIFLIGDFTGMIGDPTDKLAVRKKLTREEVLENSKNFKQQASAYLNFTGKNPAKVLYNSEWNDKLTFKDLIELASNFTVQQMIQREMFQTRLEKEKPIFLHEFLYPLTQAYDSVHMDVDLEIGGNDQMFNMLCGRDLMKNKTGKDKFVLTLKLMADEAGKKMGKSEGNVVNLDDAPEDMYGKVMSWPDNVLPVAFELCTNIDFKEIKDISKQLKSNTINPRDVKMKLAKEITRINYEEEKAQEAEDGFISKFQKKELPQENLQEQIIEQDKINIIELLISTNLSPSKSEAKRLVAQGAVKIDGEKVANEEEEVEITSKGKLLQKGKKSWLKIKK